MAGPKKKKKLQKRVSGGLLDTIAAVHGGDKAALKHAQSMSKTPNSLWTNNISGGAINNAINQGAKKGEWNAGDEQVTITGEGISKKKKSTYDAIVDIWDPKNEKWDIEIARKNLGLLQQITGKKISYMTADGTIIFADKLEGTLGWMKVVDMLGDFGDEWTGFDPDILTEQDPTWFSPKGKDQGKAALWWKLEKMGPEEFQKFLNRKGNLDRILEFGKSGDPDAPYGHKPFDMAEIMKSGGKEYLMERLQSTATSPESFRSYKDKNSPNKSDRERYWRINPPTTQGEIEEAAKAGIDSARIEWDKIKTQQESQQRKFGGIAGVGGGAGEGDDEGAGMMPSGTYLASQYNKALFPDPNLDPYKNAMYMGGPEQQHLAGGYWDPEKSKWIGSPWGTQDLWQGLPPTGVTSLEEGGPVRAPSSKVTKGGGGLFDFKPYGF